jgi:hypothetical protein
MPRQVTRITNETRLQRVLLALEQEVLQASDQELRQAAQDVGIDPDMKGSIAWVGIFYPGKVKMEEMFDLEALRRRLQKQRTALKKTE